MKTRTKTNVSQDNCQRFKIPACRPRGDALFVVRMTLVSGPDRTLGMTDPPDQRHERAMKEVVVFAKDIAMSSRRLVASFAPHRHWKHDYRGNIHRRQPPGHTWRHRNYKATTVNVRVRNEIEAGAFDDAIRLFVNQEDNFHHYRTSNVGCSCNFWKYFFYHYKNYTFRKIQFFQMLTIVYLFPFNSRSLSLSN